MVRTIQVWGLVSLGGAGNHQSQRLVCYCWQREAPQPVVFWWKQFNCQQPNGQTNYQCKLISWFRLSTATALPKHWVWLLNWEKVHVLGKYTRDSVNEWDWVYGNEINVLLLLATAPWIPMRGRWSLWQRQQGFTSSLSVRLLMWIYGAVPHRVAQTFCLHIGRYEIKACVKT